jgi:hypothetical protein
MVESHTLPHFLDIRSAHIDASQQPQVEYNRTREGMKPEAGQRLRGYIKANRRFSEVDNDKLSWMRGNDRGKKELGKGGIDQSVQCSARPVFSEGRFVRARDADKSS